MLVLTGRNLGERHREFNLRVIEAVDKKTDLNKIKFEEQQEDIDKLFLVDLASRLKNIDYILDTLKSGDSLYVTRALKCTWIYDDTYANLINPSYLHHNIFPYMSQRMKTKMLTTISLHVRHGDRVVCFYSYCMNCKLNRIALKFLIYTPDAFKMDLITSDDDFDDDFNDSKCLKQFIGNSFELATEFVNMHCVEYRNDVVHELRFLYFEFREDYLDMMEKYVQINVTHPNSIKRLGIRISRDILKRHKSRIRKYPVLYANKLNKSMLFKHLTQEDVENLATLLMPDTASDFWTIDFYHSYKFILDIIPSSKCLAFLKKIFTNKYSEELFEMDIQFYNLKYYEILTAEERESWALLHIKREQELFGSGYDYIWYKFVSFDKAFPEIKRYVFKTPDGDERSSIVNTLIDSAESQDDLTTLLNYYYDRHVNENDDKKTDFLDEIISKHDIYSFTDECWAPFHKLLHSLEVYNKHNTIDCYSSENKPKRYVIRSMIYHILNNKEFPEELQNFINFERQHSFHIYKDIILALTDEKRNIVIRYWLNFHANKLKVFLEKPRDDYVEEDLEDQVQLVWSIIWYFNGAENECPEIVITYMNSNRDKYDYPAFREKFKIITEGDFVRSLKKDQELATERISDIMCNAYRRSFKLNRLFAKLKVYFSKDVSQKYLQYFLDSLEWLRDVQRYHRNIKMAVVAVFQLGSEEFKNSFLEKYAPTNRKIDHENIDYFLLKIQKAICSLSFYSRSPLQFSSIFKYVKGDYLRFCLPMFNNYLVSLPMPRAQEFIHKVIASPVSIQKHGLRLAFECFSSQDLVNVVMNIWKKTKNVSIRMFMYKTLYRKMVNGNGDSQNVMYDVLKIWTLELDLQDHEDLFNLLVSNDMPREFRGVYIETGWRAVDKLSNKNVNLVRKTKLIRFMKENIYLMSREFLWDHVIEKHVRDVLYDERLKSTYNSTHLDDFMKAKWDLTATYIASNSNGQILIENQQLAEDILTKCIQMWSHQHKGAIYRQFCTNFLNTLHDESCFSIQRYINVATIYQGILYVLETSLPKEELYLPMWKLKLSIYSRKVLFDHCNDHDECVTYKYPCQVEIADAFAKKTGNLLQELLQRKQLFYSFFLEMANTLRNVCYTMSRRMKINPDGFKILVCGYLSRLKINEAHVFAVMVIPKDPPSNWEKRHKNAVDMIRQCNGLEIRTLLHNKFVPGGGVRKIV